MTKAHAGIIGVLLGSLSAAPAAAVNLMSMGELPIRYMSDEDRRILKDAAQSTLEEGADGATTLWENPLTGARGELTPRAAFDRDGLRCRDIEVANSAQGRSNRLVLTACKQSDGEWKIEPR